MSDTVRISKKNLESEDIRKFKEICEENVYSCYQCGKCSAGCPAAEEMDIMPHQIIHLVQMGLIDEVLNSKTIWICASCLTCAARCPRGVDLTNMMEALRQIILRDKKNQVEIDKIDPELLAKLPQIAVIGNFRKMTL